MFEKDRLTRAKSDRCRNLLGHRNAESCPVRVLRNSADVPNEQLAAVGGQKHQTGPVRTDQRAALFKRDVGHLLYGGRSRQRFSDGQDAAKRALGERLF